MLQMVHDITVEISITQQFHLQFGTEIIIERKSRAVSQFISCRIESYLADKLSFHISGTLGTRPFIARRSRNLIIHALGIEIITLLHHLVQNLIHRMESGTDRKGTRRASLLRSPEAGIFDALLTELGKKLIHKDVLALEYQWRKHRIIIIPAPAFTQQISILQRAVGIDAATDGIHSHFLQTIDKCRHIIAVETGIHTAYTIDITRQYSILNGTGIFQSGFKLVRTAQLIERRNGSQEFHRTCRTHQLSFISLIDTRVSRQVPDHQSYL